MATPTFCCGFECGNVDTTASNCVHWVASTVGTPGATVSTSTVRSGSRALRINTTIASGLSPEVTTLSGVISSQLHVVRLYIRFTSFPASDMQLVSFTFNTSGIFFQASDSTLRCGGSILNFGATGVVITTGVWYRVDIKVNASTNPHTIDGMVDGVALGQATNAVGAVTATTLRLGDGSRLRDSDIFYDDVIYSATLADYPFGSGYVNHFVPASDGTHTSTGTTTVKGTIAAPTAGGAITNATTDAFNWVNGVPLLGGATDNTRLINAQTAASGTYAEVKFGAAPGISTPTAGPRAVEVATADREATTATADFTVKLNDNGTESTVIGRGVVAGVVTDRFARKHYALAPTGGAWNANSSGAAAFNNIRARFGYSSDATPDQYWRGIMIEAEFAVTTVASTLTATAASYALSGVANTLTYLAAFIAHKPIIFSQALNRSNNY